MAAAKKKAKRAKPAARKRPPNAAKPRAKPVAKSKPAAKARGGGWNRKSIEEHIQDGTYRADRHGKIASVELELRKPPGLCRDTARSQSRWVRNASDERAVRAGCRFNERLAEYVVDFFRQYLCHSKSEWAGQPFELTPWQRDELVYPLFGWVRSDGTRRFRRTYIEVPKKNYKSTTASGIGLYMLVADGEAGAEIWSLGGDKSQARVVHDEAVHMIEASPKLASILKIHHSTFNVSYPALKSYYRAVSASPRGKHGPSLHCAIADELHEWYGDELWKSIRYAFRARPQPLLLVITNAGNDTQSLCYRVREKALGVLSGALQDDDFFALVSAASREEAEAEINAVKDGGEDLPIARRCNPGLGHVIRERDLLQDIRDAIAQPTEMGNLLRLTYGIWDTAVSPWLQTPDWEKCGAEYTPESLAGQSCHAALDMSKTGDMTALAMVFPDPDDPDFYRQLVRFWIPEETVEKRKHLIDYRAWQKAGVLEIIPGPVIDYALIRQRLAEACAQFDVLTFSYDAMYAKETAQWVGEEFPQIEVIEFPQTLMHFAGPTAEYERLVLAGKLLHDRNALLTWQAGHCKVLTDANRNKRPVKPKPHDIRSVDGIVAGIMALRRAMGAPEAVSAYESHGVMYADDILGDDPAEPTADDL